MIDLSGELKKAHAMGRGGRDVLYRLVWQIFSLACTAFWTTTTNAGWSGPVRVDRRASEIRGKRWPAAGLSSVVDDWTCVVTGLY